MTKAKNWAIVVGVNAYKNIGRLEYANRDAEAMHNFFVKAKFDRVFWFADGITLPSSSEQNSTDPTSSDLVDFLHDRFSTKVPPLAPGDNCWFFFAGHGKRIDDCDYLLPIDYNPRLADHEKRAIPVNFVRERLLKSGADNVILLLDACRTEGDRADGLGIGDVQPGAITIFSCQRNRKAYEIEALKQGAFTAALLEALQMPGERNCATVERLDLYLRDRVPQLCQLYNKPEQVPMTLVEPRQKSYLILLPHFATDWDIFALKSQAQGAELNEHFDVAEQLWFRYGLLSSDREAFVGYARVQRRDGLMMNINCQQKVKNSIGFPTASQSSLTSTTVKQIKLIIRSNILQGIYVLKLLSEQLLRISNVLQTSFKAVKFVQPHADFPWLMICVLGICYLPIGLLAGRSEIWILAISLIVVWTGAAFATWGISFEQIRDWSFQKDSSFFVSLSLGVIWATGGVIAGFYVSAWPFVWAWSCVWLLSIGMIQQNEASSAWSWFAIPTSLTLGMLVGHFTEIGIGWGFAGAFFAVIQFIGIIGTLALPTFLASSKKKKKYCNFLVCGLAPSLGLIAGKLVSVLLPAAP